MDIRTSTSATKTDLLKAGGFNLKMDIKTGTTP